MLVLPLIPFATSPLQLPMMLAVLILMSVSLVWYTSSN